MFRSFVSSLDRMSMTNLWNNRVASLTVKRLLSINSHFYSHRIEIIARSSDGEHTYYMD